MDKSLSNQVTRRSFLLSSAALGMALLADPAAAFGMEVAQEQESGRPNGSCLSVEPGLTLEELEAYAQRQAEEDTARIIREILLKENPDGIVPLSRENDFTTTYGKQVAVNTPYKAVAGQLAGGTMFKHGGSIGVVERGGGTINMTYSFPTPFGSLGVSGPLGKQVATTAAIYIVDIPAGAHYKVTQSDKLYCTPWIIYRTVNGKKVQVEKGASSVHYDQTFDYVKM